ncbi:MAG: hypothetical protein NC311_15920, partial [Muribaculaceae bacterium]|nr:hypothetical protein [Muribaculaceae bacterium]
SKYVPLRTGVREDSIVVTYKGTPNDAGAVNATTDTSRIVLDRNTSYELNISDLKLKEYTGFNLFVPQTKVSYLDTDEHPVKPNETLTVDVIDDSLVVYEWTGNGTSLRFKAKYPDKFGTTTVVLTYDYDNKANGVYYHYVYQFVVNVKDTNNSTKGSMTVAKVIAGDYNSAVLRPDGTVWTWGEGVYGQLGNGETPPRNAYPVQVLQGAQGSKGYICGQCERIVDESFFTGDTYTCLTCGAIIDKTTAQTTTALHDIVSIYSGGDYILALDRFGYVWGWGRNTRGQLGAVNKEANALPVAIPFTYPNGKRAVIVDLATSANFALALDSNGYVWAWGDRTYNQLGEQLYSPSGYTTAPQRVLAGMAASGIDTQRKAGDTNVPAEYLGHVVAIAAGSYSSMAIRSNGTVFTWGRNTSGQNGIGITKNNTPAATPVRAIKTENTDYAKSNTTRSADPRSYNDVNGVDMLESYYRTNEFMYQVASAALGDHHALLLTHDNSVYGLGHNDYGEMGLQVSTASGATNNYLLPTLVFADRSHSNAAKDSSPTVTVLQMSGDVAARDANGNYIETTSTLYKEQETIVAVYATYTYSGFRTIKALQTVADANSSRRELTRSYTFGYNNFYQLGNGSTVMSYLPIRTRKGAYEEYNDDFQYLEGVYDMSLGRYHVLTISLYYKQLTDYNDGVLDGMLGYVWGWGNNATRSNSNVILGQLSSLVSTRINLPSQIGAREKLELVVDYMEAREYNGNGVRAWRSDYTGHKSRGNVSTADKYSDNDLTLGYYDVKLPVDDPNASYTLLDTVPPFIILGANEELVIYKENTHLHYSSGFSLYPMEHDLNSVLRDGSRKGENGEYVPLGEIWSGVTSNPDIASVKVNNNAPDNATIYNDDYRKDPDDYFTGRTTLTLSADYNNGPGKSWNNYEADDWQVFGDYDLVGSHIPDMVFTGNYVFTLDIDLQPSSTTIIPKAVAGQNYSAMNTSEGNVWVWGDNVYGILGQGNTAGMQSVSLQVENTYGIHNDGGAKSVASVSTAVSNPQKVKKSDGTYLDTIMAIAAGYHHMVALDRDGQVWSWGLNNYGQLGLGDTTNRSLAHKVTIKEDGKDVNIVALAAGQYHTLALSDKGEVWSWGLNSDGQLGLESLSNYWVNVNSTPKKVKGPLGEGYLNNVTMISAGGNASAALKGDGTVWTWGDNSSGQLGIGTNEQHLGVPVQTLRGDSDSSGNYLENISHISMGHNHMLAIQSIVVPGATQDDPRQQKIWGWGSNSNYQLTKGPAQETAQGVKPYTTENYRTPKLQYVSAGYYDFEKDLYGDETLYGNNDWLHHIKTVEAGYLNSAAIQRIKKVESAEDLAKYPTGYIRNAEVFTWGYGNLGVLGDNSTGSHNLQYPTMVLDGETKQDSNPKPTDIVDSSVDTQGYKVTETTGHLTSVKYIGMGVTHMSALRYDGYVWGWGDNRRLQLGNITRGSTDNGQPIISGYRYDGSVVVTMAAYQKSGDTTALDDTTSAGEVVNAINGVTYTTSTGNEIAAMTNVPNSSRTQTNAPNNTMHYRMNESQQLRLEMGKYMAYTGTKATTGRTLVAVGQHETVSTTTGEGADAVTTVTNDPRVTNYVDALVVDDSILKLYHDTASGQWVIRSTGREEYGETEVVFRAYEALRDIHNDPIEDPDAEPVTYNGVKYQPYKYQCVAQSTLVVEVYPASGIATP